MIVMCKCRLINVVTMCYLYHILIENNYAHKLIRFHKFVQFYAKLYNDNYINLIKM